MQEIHRFTSSMSLRWKVEAFRKKREALVEAFAKEMESKAVEIKRLEALQKAVSDEFREATFTAIAQAKTFANT